MERKYIDVLNDAKLNMWIDISTYCNASCPECHRTDIENGGLGKVQWLPLVQWTFEEFKKSYPPSFVSKTNRWEFCGTWGDPVMNKDLLDICQYVSDNTPTDGVVEIDTNGSIRPLSWWEKLGKIRKIKVDFAIEGVTQEMHSFYRRRTDLAKILANMKRFTDAGGIATGFCVIHKHNQDHLLEIENLCKAYGAVFVDFIESNRFHKSPLFHFFNEEDKIEVLEKPTNYQFPGEVNHYGKTIQQKNNTTEWQLLARQVENIKEEPDIGESIVNE